MQRWPMVLDGQARGWGPEGTWKIIFNNAKGGLYFCPRWADTECMTTHKRNAKGRLLSLCETDDVCQHGDTHTSLDCYARYIEMEWEGGPLSKLMTFDEWARVIEPSFLHEKGAR